MEAGTVLADRYKLAERLGRGAMGEVWRAQDSRLYDRDVAVKMLLVRDPNPDDLERFTREAGVAARLAHPGITVVHDIGRHEDQVFIVMELLRGENLGALLAKHPQGLPVSQVASFAVQVASALASAHAAGVIHRDLKPANLFVQGDHVKICDFGLARDDAFRTITMAGEVIGTPAYMAPEQWRGEPATSSSDLYALGGIIAQMLTGELPFPGPSIAALLNQHLNVAPIPPASRVAAVPPALNDLVLSLLAKDPADRPPSTTWVLETLTRIRDLPRDWPDLGLQAASSAAALPLAAPVPSVSAGPLASGAPLASAVRPSAGPLEPAEPPQGEKAPQPEKTSRQPAKAGRQAAKPARAASAAQVTAVPRFQPHPPQANRVGPVASIACAPLGPELRVFALTSAGRIRHSSRPDPTGKTSGVGAPARETALADPFSPAGAAGSAASRDAVAASVSVSVSVSAPVSVSGSVSGPGSGSVSGSRDGAAPDGASGEGASRDAGSSGDPSRDASSRDAGSLEAGSGGADSEATASVTSGAGWTSWIDVLSPTGQQPVAAIAATSAHATYLSLLAEHNSALAAVAGDDLYISRSGSAWRSLDGPGGQPVSAHILDVAVASWTRAALSSQPGEPRSLPSPVSVFALDADGKVWRNSRSGWRAIPVSRPVTAIAACSFRNEDQLLLCVADGTVSVAHYESQSGAASSLPTWPYAPAVRVVDIACLSLAADHQEAFALDAGGNVWHSRSAPPTQSGPGQQPPTAPWTAWTRIDGAPGSVTAIAAGSQGDGDGGQGTLLLATADGTIHHSSCDLDPARESAWASWSQLPPL